MLSRGSRVRIVREAFKNGHERQDCNFFGTIEQITPFLVVVKIGETREAFNRADLLAPGESRLQIKNEVGEWVNIIEPTTEAKRKQYRKKGYR